MFRGRSLSQLTVVCETATDLPPKCGPGFMRVPPAHGPPPFSGPPLTLVHGRFGRLPGRAEGGRRLLPDGAVRPLGLLLVPESVARRNVLYCALAE
jgi:hypothetical protein